MEVSQKYLDCVYKAVDILIENYGNSASALTKNPDTILYGAGSQIDSLSMVTLIAELENVLREEMELDVTIADERAMSQRSSPFRSLGSLAAYVELLAKEAKGQA